MYYNLGIGVAFKSAAAVYKLVSKLRKVFDNSVVHNGKATVRAHMRVGVYIVGHTVGCPTGVADTGIALNRFAAFDFFAEIFYFAGGFYHRNSLAAHNGDSCGIITAIFKLFKSFNYHRNGAVTSGKADNSTHICFFLSKDGFTAKPALSERQALTAE